ncbi:MAG: diacylglycerol kinase family protein [Ruminococcus sp.]|nr:diacylglycerol kinase family protein [Ruminococcus sp.]
MKKQIKSFGFAFEGIFSAVKSEAHLRFHLVAAFYVFLFAFLGGFSPTQWGVLAITCALVIFAELVNTALEEVCDLYSTEHNPRIKRIKDISAGAVLVLAFAACAVAVSLFLCTGKLLVAFEKLTASPLWFIPLGASCVLSVLFVALFGKKPKKHK